MNHRFVGRKKPKNHFHWNKAAWSILQVQGILNSWGYVFRFCPELPWEMTNPEYMELYRWLESSGHQASPVSSSVQGLGSHGLKPAKQGQVRWSTAWTWQPALDHEYPVKCLLFNTSFPPPTLFWSIPDLVFTRDFDSHSVEPNRVRGRWAQRLHVRALVSAYMALKSQLRPLLTMWPGKKQLWPCFFIGKRGQ